MANFFVICCFYEFSLLWCNVPVFPEVLRRFQPFLFNNLSDLLLLCYCYVAAMNATSLSISITIQLTYNNQHIEILNANIKSINVKLQGCLYLCTGGVLRVGCHTSATLWPSTGRSLSTVLKLVQGMLATGTTMLSPSSIFIRNDLLVVVFVLLGGIIRTTVLLLITSNWLMSTKC